MCMTPGFTFPIRRRNTRGRSDRKGKTKDLIRKKAYMKYYMHGVGHYLGLDVHDAGLYFSDQTAKHSRPFRSQGQDQGPDQEKSLYEILYARCRPLPRPRCA